MSLTITELTQHIGGHVNFPFKWENVAVVVVVGGGSSQWQAIQDIIILNVFTHCGSGPTGSNNSTVCCTKQCSFVNNLSALGNSIWNSVALQSSLRGTQVKQRTVWDLAFKYRELCQCGWHAICYCMCLYYKKSKLWNPPKNSCKYAMNQTSGSTNEARCKLLVC